jgi:dephospho-CoA kinase
MQPMDALREKFRLDIREMLKNYFAELTELAHQTPVVVIASQGGLEGRWLRKSALHLVQAFNEINQTYSQIYRNILQQNAQLVTGERKTVLLQEAQTFHSEASRAFRVLVVKATVILEEASEKKIPLDDVTEKTLREMETLTFDGWLKSWLET